MSAESHTKFRTSKKWKEFRKSLIESRTAACELCGTKYSGKRQRQLQVHHLDPANYEDLTPEKFALLDASCHDLIERFSTKLKGSKSGNIPRLEDWIKLLYVFLPYEIQKVVVNKYDDYLSSKMCDIWKKLRWKNND